MVEEEFLGKLIKLVEDAIGKNNSVEFREIDRFCKEAKLTGDQMDIVYQYLEDNKIEVIQTGEVEPEFTKDGKLLEPEALLIEPTDDDLEEEEENIDLDAINLLDGDRKSTRLNSSH